MNMIHTLTDTQLCLPDTSENSNTVQRSAFVTTEASSAALVSPLHGSDELKGHTQHCTKMAFSWHSFHPIPRFLFSCFIFANSLRSQYLHKQMRRWVNNG